MSMAASGVVDPHPRVKFAGIACLGLQLSEQAPTAQKKFHAEILPQLIKIMRDDPSVKIKTQATSATINFVRELIIVDEKDLEETKKEAGVMENYTETLLETCAQLIELSLVSPFTPLQEEVLALLSCIAQLIEDKFAEYYNQFMPGLKSILENTPSDSQANLNLRSNTIQCIGFLLEAVKDKREEFVEDAKQIATAFMQLLQPGVLKDDDPSVISLT